MENNRKTIKSIKFLVTFLMIAMALILFLIILIPQIITSYLFVIIVTFLLILGLISIILGNNAILNYNKSFLENQAIKRNGTVSRKFLFYPKLNFSYNTNRVEVFVIPKAAGNIYTAHGRSWVYIRVKLNIQTNKMMFVCGDKFQVKIRRALKMQNITVGSTFFDKSYMIKGDDEDYIKNLLDFNTQKMILSIIEFNPLIILRNNLLEMRIPDEIRDNAILDKQIDIVLEITDRINKMKV